MPQAKEQHGDYCRFTRVDLASNLWIERFNVTSIKDEFCIGYVDFYVGKADLHPDLNIDGQFFIELPVLEEIVQFMKSKGGSV